jgi:hypothetical protein
MNFNRGNLCWRDALGRMISGVTLLAYLVAALGFPIPVTTANAPAGASACGQRVCCCGSVTKCRGSGCGCSHTPLPKPAVPTCCIKKPSQPKPSPKKSSLQWVISMSAQKCGGAATEWIHAQAALPGPLPETWQPSLPFCHSVPVLQEYHFTLALDRLDPPPRSFSL